MLIDYDLLETQVKADLVVHFVKEYAELYKVVFLDKD